jgi:hypothetical protein
MVNMTMYLSLLAISLLPICSAWGNLAHRTIALIAERQILDLPAHHYIQTLLGNTSISNAAIWPDTYKLLPEGRYTSSWHFLNVDDDPPTSCYVPYPYDASRPCIIDAIRNMTRRVNDLSLVHDERKMALMFLIHLIGDLHCPLHIEGLLRGGNDLPVLWNGKETSLHFVWDVYIPQKVTNSTDENEEAAAVAWMNNLSKNKDDDNLLEKHEPVLYRSEMWASLKGEEVWALTWARESNTLVCEVVLKDGIDNVKGVELAHDYYKRSIPVVEHLVKVAGLRLAAVISSLAEEAKKSVDHQELK